MSSAPRDYAGSAAASSGDPPVLPVSRKRDAIRVFGRVDVRKVQTNNLRSDIRQLMVDTFGSDIQRIRQMHQKQINKWSEIQDDQKRQWHQMPSVLCVSPTERATVTDIEQRWFESFNQHVIERTGLASLKRHASAVRIDACLDLYGLVGDLLPILLLFATEFQKDRIKSRGDRPTRTCFYLFMRLPPSKHHKVMDCMNVVIKNGLQSQFPLDNDEWLAFAAAMVVDHMHYERLEQEYASGPPGEDHTLEFESKETYENRPQLSRLHGRKIDTESENDFTESFMGDADPDDHLSARGIQSLAAFDPDTWHDPHSESKVAEANLQQEIDGNLRVLKYIHPIRLQQEILAAVVKPSPATTFIGSSSFPRLYHVMQFLNKNCLLIYFEDRPIFQQFSRLIRWALWQLFHWDNVWYHGFVFDEDLQNEIERTIEYTPQNYDPTDLPDDVRDQVVQSFARGFRMTEYSERQFAFQSLMTFEDVVASVPWAHTIQATRQAVFDAFPPELIRERYNLFVSGDATAQFQAAFKQVWNRNMSSAHARDASMNNVHTHVGHLVDQVLQNLTFTQLVENTDHNALHVITFLMYLTWWQFSGPPKVNVLKYVIQRLLPNAATLSQLIYERDDNEWQHIHLSGPFADMFGFSNFSLGKLQKTFLAYAKWLKRRDNLNAVLVTSNVIPALLDGVNKTMPMATPKQGAAAAGQLLYPDDNKYSTPEKHIGISADVLNGQVLGFLGLKENRGGSTDHRILVTPKEYLALNPHHRLENGIDPRKQEAFVREYDPLRRTMRSSTKQPNTVTTATTRSSNAIMGESASAPPSSKRSK